MPHTTDAGSIDPRLLASIERSGYYPALVAEAVESALGGEPVISHLVHQETTFDAEEVRRHVTVLALTARRLIVGHTDEHGTEPELDGVDSQVGSYASTSTETVRLDQVSTVVVTRVVDDPARHVRGTLPREVVLTVGWGAVGRIDLEPAGCADPNCDADHGYTGTVTRDDLSLRVSTGADGPDAVRDTLDFARALAAATVGNQSVLPPSAAHG
ncbi:MAG TPA: DUF5998 family protein [Actinocrinis sp.]|jgi:hypothetical protein